MQRPSAVAQEQAGHRRAAGRYGQAASQDRDHLAHVVFGVSDAGAAQRPARRARYRRLICQFQDADPAVGELQPSCWRDDLPGVNCQRPAGSRLAPPGELAIQGRGQNTGQEARPQAVAVRTTVVPCDMARCDVKQQV